MYIVYNHDLNIIIEFDEIHDYNDFLEYISNKKNITYQHIYNKNDKDLFISKYFKYIDMDSICNGLNQQQIHVLDSIKNSDNIFITGNPGTGKSFTLMRIIKYLDIIKGSKYALTATTGCAAVNINGQTIHSLLKITPFTTNYKKHAENLLQKSKINKLIHLEVLILEEISMLDNLLFEGISTVFQIIKGNQKPFGGIQLILSGDFNQLPPINNTFCYHSLLWDQLNIKTIELTESFRHKEDILFQKILDKIKKKQISKTLIDFLAELKNTTFDNGIIPTKLYPLNIDVDRINNNEMHKLRKDGRKFVIYKAISNSPLLETDKYDIELCIDAQIMIIRNIDIDNRLVNGTRGIVIGLENNFINIKLLDGTTHFIYYTKDFMDIYKTKHISFLPVKIANAISIHKCQGMTLDAIEIDLGNVFEKGQAYTGLSRCRTLKNIRITNINNNAFK